MNEERKRLKTDKQYVDLSGLHCPVCDSTQVITPGSVEVHTTYGLQPCRCENCGAEWNDRFLLDGYEDLVDKEGNPLEPESDVRRYENDEMG